MKKIIYFAWVAVISFTVQISCSEKKGKDDSSDDEKYIENSLQTGSTPYSAYYENSDVCLGRCSEIRVKTHSSDVVVTIKQDDKVVQHAYIKAGDEYTFSLYNGVYQPFFYSGKGWNPNKVMKNGQMKGGFIAEESFGKDTPQAIQDASLTYELIPQPNGNFSTRISDADEAL